jgi:hypothetical protein
MGKDPDRPNQARNMQSSSSTEDQVSAEREGVQAGMGVLPENDSHGKPHNDLKQLFTVTSTRTNYTCVL